MTSSRATRSQEKCGTSSRGETGSGLSMSPHRWASAPVSSSGV